ncbi:MAG: MBL fold metallo-hydrolase RNA specificity domain-containing protein [Geminicoccaceae bacterium]
MTAKLHFFVVAGTVTGSCYGLETATGWCMVDCGLFQGNRSIRELNYKPFPFDPGLIETLLLTHAHIDHVGLVPKLYANGFRGRILATAPTADLMSFMLPDSGNIQESEVERINRRNRRQGKPEIEPIYTLRDAEAVLELIEPVAMESWVDAIAGVRARYWNAGHILGSGSIELSVEDQGGQTLQLLFSGDLGPDEKVFHERPDAPDGFDYIVCESTYGNRDRDDVTLEARRNRLKSEINRAHEAGGNLLIPAFAVERTQELLHDIGLLMARREIPERQVFLDSPLANRVTSVFVKHSGTLEDMELDEAELFSNPNFHFIKSVDESKALNKIRSGAIIIAASGMCDAGRIRHHLKHNLWQRDATVLMVGYQAPGTLGSLLMNGEKSVQIHGLEVAVNASIRSIGNYSAHADQAELLRWIEERLPARQGIFLTHGEDKARAALKERIAGKGVDAARILMPQLDEAVDLVVGETPAPVKERKRIEPAQIETDWYNDYASLLLELSRRLDAMDDPNARRELLWAMKAILDETS